MYYSPWSLVAKTKPMLMDGDVLKGNFSVLVCLFVLKMNVRRSLLPLSVLSAIKEYPSNNLWYLKSWEKVQTGLWP